MVRLAAVAISGALVACGGHDSGALDAAGEDDAAGDSGPVPDGFPGTPITLTLNNRPNTPATFTFVVAYQDGSGPWTVAPPPTGDTYAFTINASSYGVAWTCVANALGANGLIELREVRSAYFAIVERTSLTMDIPPRCTDRFSNVGLSGTIASTNGGGLFVAQYGERNTVVAGNGNYSLETPPGTRDLFALRYQPGGNSGDATLGDAAVVRDVVVAGPTTQDVDFATSAGTQSFPVTVAIPVGGRVLTTTTLYSAGQTTVATARATTAPFVTISLAASQSIAGDVYDQAISVARNNRTATTTNATATPGAITFVAPAPIGTITSSILATTPYPIIRTIWPEYTNTIGYTWVASQSLIAAQCGGAGVLPCTLVWTAQLSPAVSGAMPSYAMPDLSALAGWTVKLQPVPGTMMTGTTQAMTSSAGAQDFPPATPPAAGTQRAFVRADWTVSP
jgi:hypothetical protein